MFHGADVNVVEAVTKTKFGNLGHNEGGELVVDICMDVDAFCRSTYLAAVDEGCERDATGGSGKVCGRHHDEWVVTRCFDEVRLELVGTRSRNCFTRGHTSREPNHVRVAVTHKMIAHGCATSDTLEQAVGQALECFHELQRRDGRELRRLNDHRIPCGERGGGFPHQQHNGEVGRKDDDNNTHRFL